MVPFDQVSTTGIYRDDTAQCYEAWLVDLVAGQKRLASTCSTSPLRLARTTISAAGADTATTSSSNGKRRGIGMVHRL